MMPCNLLILNPSKCLLIVNEGVMPLYYLVHKKLLCTNMGKSPGPQGTKKSPHVIHALSSYHITKLFKIKISNQI